VGAVFLPQSAEMTISPMGFSAVEELGFEVFIALGMEMKKIAY
jgi:hypothetical protein